MKPVRAEACVRVYAQKEPQPAALGIYPSPPSPRARAASVCAEWRARRPLHINLSRAEIAGTASRFVCLPCVVERAIKTRVRDQIGGAPR